MDYPLLGTTQAWTKDNSLAARSRCKNSQEKTYGVAEQKDSISSRTGKKQESQFSKARTPPPAMSGRDRARGIQAQQWHTEDTNRLDCLGARPPYSSSRRARLQYQSTDLDSSRRHTSIHSTQNDASPHQSGWDESAARSARLVFHHWNKTLSFCP